MPSTVAEDVSSGLFSRRSGIGLIREVGVMVEPVEFVTNEIANVSCFRREHRVQSRCLFSVFSTE
jgi:hypothetical protein